MILDIILVAFLALMFFIGQKRGLIKSIQGAVGWGIGKRTRMNRWRAGTDDIKASVLFLLLCAALLSAQYFIGKT